MSGFQKKAAAKFAALKNFFGRQWKKIATIIAGHGLYSLIGWLFDNPLYIAAIAYLGPLQGGLAMTAGSLLFCFVLLLYYRRKKVNWLGYDVLDDLKARGIEYAKKLGGWSARETLTCVLNLLFLYPFLALFVALLWLTDKFVWLWADTDKIAAVHSRHREKLREGKKVLVATVYFLPAMLFKVLMWCLRVGGDVVAFFILCVWEDPFVTTAYLRHGNHNGLRKKDLLIFFASVLVSNGYWIARTCAVIEVAKAAFRSIFH